MTNLEKWKENKLQQLYKEIDTIEEKAKKAINKVEYKIDDISAMELDDVIVEMVSSHNSCIYCKYNSEDCHGDYSCYGGIKKYLEQEVQDE